QPGPDDERGGHRTAGAAGCLERDGLQRGPGFLLLQASGVRTDGCAPGVVHPIRYRSAATAGVEDDRLGPSLNMHAYACPPGGRTGGAPGALRLRQRPTERAEL